MRVIGVVTWPHQQVAEPVHARREAWMHRYCRAVLLDDGGSGHLVSGRQRRPPVDRGIDRLRRPAPNTTGRRPVTALPASPSPSASVGEPRPLDRADPGDPQVHPLHLLARDRRGSRTRTARGAPRESPRAAAAATSGPTGPSARSARAPRRPARSTASRARTHESVLGRAKPCAVSAPCAARRELGVDRLHRRVVQLGLPGHAGADVVGADVDGQQPERRDVAGVARHQHAARRRGSRSAGRPAASRIRRT